MNNEIIMIEDLDNDIILAQLRLQQLSCPVPPIGVRQEMGDLPFLNLLNDLIHHYQGMWIVFPMSYVCCETDNNCCGICLDSILLGEDQSSFACNHYFHGWCLLKFLQTPPVANNVCPICREIKIEMISGPNFVMIDDDDDNEDEE